MLLLGVDPLEKGLAAEPLREREAASVAAAVRAAIDEEWQVDDGNDGWRDARLGDICILLPARTSLYFLERALDDAGVSYRAETSSLVYGTREVRDLLMALRAIDDPSDQLALVSALRSSLFGCGDDDLFRFHAEHNGQFDLLHDAPGFAPAAIIRSGEAMRYLARAPPERTWVDAERAPRARGARAPRVGSRRGFRPLSRCRPPSSIRGRPVARVRRRRRRLAARLPGLGDAAGHGGRARRGDRAPRDRRRCGADHDDPRCQGARVPDRDLFGCEHPRATRAAVACSCSSRPPVATR